MERTEPKHAIIKHHARLKNFWWNRAEPFFRPFFYDRERFEEKGPVEINRIRIGEAVKRIELINLKMGMLFSPQFFDKKRYVKRRLIIREKQ